MRRGQRDRLACCARDTRSVGRLGRAARAVIGDDLAVASRLNQRETIAADPGRLRLDHAEQRTGRHRRVRGGAAGSHAPRSPSAPPADATSPPSPFWAWTVDRPARWKFLMPNCSLYRCYCTSPNRLRAGAALLGTFRAALGNARRRAAMPFNRVPAAIALAGTKVSPPPPCLINHGMPYKVAAFYQLPRCRISGRLREPLRAICAGAQAEGQRAAGPGGHQRHAGGQRRRDCRVGRRIAAAAGCSAAGSTISS